MNEVCKLAVHGEFDVGNACRGLHFNIGWYYF